MASTPTSRADYCRSIVRSGPFIVRDGQKHDCQSATTSGDGYYCVLLDYDETTDTFGVGYEKRIPAKFVAP